MEALTTALARLSLRARRCAESLAAVAAVATEPQWRAELAHRANLQHCAAAELAARAGIPDEGADDPPVSLREIPPFLAGKQGLIDFAAQQAARAAAAYGDLLREPLDDVELRLLLAHYYRGATELQRLLEQRAMDLDHSHSDERAAHATPPLHR
ncbi:hypothetical protein [Cupriavidus metallidurans]|uniref:hypothetical protein n=1 Tax=Cupriavidus metallidurans TaxID=119219 RepID=UPI00055FE3A1|nr:hypothetical protein [Cupriavidus metallidurans]